MAFKLGACPGIGRGGVAQVPYLFVGSFKLRRTRRTDRGALVVAANVYPAWGVVGMLALRARSRRGLGPFYVALLAALLLLLSKFYLDHRPSMDVGAALLIGASVWNSLPKKELHAGQPDCRC